MRKKKEKVITTSISKVMTNSYKVILHIYKLTTKSNKAMMHDDKTNNNNK